MHEARPGAGGQDVLNIFFHCISVRPRAVRRIASSQRRPARKAPTSEGTHSTWRIHMSSTHASPWLDSPQAYGSITRFLHWGMAALFAWQFASSALHAWNREAGISRWFWQSHVSLGEIGRHTSEIQSLMRISYAVF